MLPNAIIYTAPQTLKCFRLKAPQNSTVPNAVFLGGGFCNAKRLWTQTLQKFCNVRHYYLQGSAKIKGFGGKPPKSSAMPNAVIYRVPQRLKALVPNNPKVPQCQTLLRTLFCSARKVLDPNLPEVPQCQTVVFTGFRKD